MIFERTNMKRIGTLVLTCLLLAACGAEPQATPAPEAEVEPTEVITEVVVEAEPTEEVIPTNTSETETVEEAEASEESEAGAEAEADTDAEEASAELESEGMTANELAIPPLLDYTIENGAKVFDITLQDGEVEFIEGIPSPTKGFNGDYLGPTIRVDKGDDVVINVTNSLDEATTVHWHGLDVPAEMDGSPHQPIEAGGEWQAFYPIINEASTMWYHPHIHGNSAEQVSFGLAGLYLIDDENSKSLDIPQTYGVDDIPLVIQDRKFEDGVMVGETKGGLYYGDTILTNGTLDAYVEVPAKQIRLRLVNGSLSRVYSFGFADGREFHQIGSDGGLLESPAPMTSLLMATGERTEIVVDLSDGEEAVLMSFDDEALTGDNGGEYTILRLIPDVEHELAESNPSALPEVLNVIERYSEEDAVVVRPIVLGGEEITEEDPTDLYIETEHGDQENSGPSGIPINGKVMDMSRIDEVVNFGDIEIWEISNDGEGHPIHIHLVQFQVLDRNGEPPEAYESGWKDTVWVGRGETVRVIAKFDTYTSETIPYMFHCHILQHEDGGMMGQFIIVDEEAVANGQPSILDHTYSSASAVPSGHADGSGHNHSP